MSFPRNCFVHVGFRSCVSSSCSMAHPVSLSFPVPILTPLPPLSLLTSFCLVYPLARLLAMVQQLPLQPLQPPSPSNPRQPLLLPSLRPESNTPLLLLALPLALPLPQPLLPPQLPHLPKRWHLRPPRHWKQPRARILPLLWLAAAEGRISEEKKVWQGQRRQTLVRRRRRGE